MDRSIDTSPFFGTDLFAQCETHAKIVAAICFPDDEASRNSLSARYFLKSLHENGCTDAVGDKIAPVKLARLAMDCAIHPITDVDVVKAWGCAMESARVLESYYCLDIFNHGPSIRKAIYFMKEVREATNGLGEKKRPATEQGIRNSWNTHRHVAHLALAARLYLGGQDDKDVCLFRFCEIAERLRAYGELKVEARTSLPLLDPDRAWRLTPEIQGDGGVLPDLNRLLHPMSLDVVEKLYSHVMEGYSKRKV